VFVAKGRDGKTDIWGILCRPKDVDPTKKYPVIEYIYAGPQSSYVPKRFSPTSQFTSLTNLGFIVVQMDGMGTANRSKAFHDVCWKNLKDAGFPDRILWHQAVAKKYACYDISRVGVYGNSAGGQSAAGAVLFHPEFYKAAVASCGCHDNRMDKASWNEQWMGYPVGPCYAECSNIDNAHRLRGKLFLIVGEMDNNVPPESTTRFVDALVKAGKDFDPRRRSRHGWLLRPAADGGFLRTSPARHGAARPQRRGRESGEPVGAGFIPALLSTESWKTRSCNAHETRHTLRRHRFRKLSRIVPNHRSLNERATGAVAGQRRSAGRERLDLSSH
jgi:hypothetical protein